MTVWNSDGSREAYGHRMLNERFISCMLAVIERNVIDPEQ